jgi:hypothetical protein
VRYADDDGARDGRVRHEALFDFERVDILPAYTLVRSGTIGYGK